MAMNEWRAEGSQGTTVQYRSSRSGLVFPLLITIALAVGGLLLATTSDETSVRVVGGACAALFVLCSAAIARAVVDRRPRVIINAQGVTDRGLGMGLIEWTDILELRPMTVYGSTFAALSLRNPQKYLRRRKRLASRMARINVALGFGEINLNLTHLEVPPDVALQALNEHYRRAAQRWVTVPEPVAFADAPSMPSQSGRRHAERAEFAHRLQQIAPHVYAVPVLIAANVLVFIWMVSQGVGFFQPSTADILAWGGNFGAYTTQGQWWRLASSMFVHVGILHLALNMWVLYSIGGLAERMYGTPRFLALYVFAGLTGSLTSLLWNSDVVSAGASGAVFGVFGALVAFLLRPRSGVPASVLNEHLVSIGIFFVINLMFGFTMAGIDNAAHLGGAAGGALVGYLLARPLLPEVRRTVGFGSCFLAAAAGATMLCALAWPLLHPSAERQNLMDFHHAVQAFPDRERQAVDAFNAAIDQMSTEALHEAAAADRLEADVLPLWNDLHALFAMSAPADERLAGMQAAFLRYIGNRRQAITLMIEALRYDDGERMRQANQLLEAGKQDIDNIERASGRRD